MKVVQIIHGISNQSAGSTYFVGKLADELHRNRNDSTILTLGNRPKVWSYEAPLTVHSKIIERRLGVSVSLLREVRRIASHPAILHGHGVWRATNLFPLLLDENISAKIIFSTHGTLTPWSMRYKSALKIPFWHLFQKNALQRGHCYHVTSPSEYEDIRRVGLRGDVAIIPIGMDIPALSSDIQRNKTIVFLGRIDPVKGLDILIKSWAAVTDSYPEWELIIAGPLDCEYANYIRKLAYDMKAPRIKFVGQIFENDKYNLLSRASLFILPSYSENFGIVVAEALAHGVPVITSTETPWQEIYNRGCGWVISPEKDALETVLRDALSQSLPALQEMGGRGRRWMEDDYSWKHIGSMMQKTYEWMLHGGGRPAWVESI